MRFQLYGDVQAFYEAAYPALMRGEAQNLVPLGNVLIGVAGTDKTGWRDPANWLMATVMDGDAVLLTALMTPPHNLTPYAPDNRCTDEAVRRLAQGLLETGVPVPGVMAENSLAERFAAAYGDASHQSHQIVKRQRIYELAEVSPAIPAVGFVRPARESDLAFLPYWFEGFQSDCFGTTPSARVAADDSRYHIRSGRLFILEDGGTPVSMAKVHRELRTACGVGYVYTPPYFRGRGYASTLVAEVSRMILKRGFLRCVLYTDLANPISNSIYQKIGYRPVCDSLEIRFLPTAEA